MLLSYFFVHWTHKISNFEPDSAYFYEVPFLDFVAGEFHLFVVDALDHLPDLFFWLAFKHLVYCFVNQVFVVYPVRIVFEKEPANYFFIFFWWQVFVIFLELIVSYCLHGYFGF